MKFAVNHRTGSLAQRVKEDFRMLSNDAKTLLRQALSDDLPQAGQKLMSAAGDRLDRGKALLASRTRSFRRSDTRTPFLLGALGVAALAGTAAWLLLRRSSEDCEVEAVTRTPDDDHLAA